MSSSECFYSRPQILHGLYKILLPFFTTETYWLLWMSDSFLHIPVFPAHKSESCTLHLTPALPLLCNLMLTVSELHSNSDGSKSLDLICFKNLGPVLEMVHARVVPPPEELQTHWSGLGFKLQLSALCWNSSSYGSLFWDRCICPIFLWTSSILSL